MNGIVDGEVESAALLALEGPAGDEVAHVDHVTQFADILRRLDTLEESMLFISSFITDFCLFEIFS